MREMTRLNEKELELAHMISGECKNPSDVTETLKRLFAGTLEQIDLFQNLPTN